MGEDLGEGLVKGVAQELGFGSIFKDFLGPGTGLEPWESGVGSNLVWARWTSA